MRISFHPLLATILLAGALIGPASTADAQRPPRSPQPNQERELRPPPNLQNDPRYRGRVLGTHVIRHPRTNQILYEMRILTPDDRVILVYVDPQTGRVVGDTAGGRR